jgi:hypothetical protein
VSKEDALGIVVSYGVGVPQPPSVLAFVWGKRVEKHPSLRYGRWKEADRD